MLKSIIISILRQALRGAPLDHHILMIIKLIMIFESWWLSRPRCLDLGGLKRKISALQHAQHSSLRSITIFYDHRACLKQTGAAEMLDFRVLIVW